MLTRSWLIAPARAATLAALLVFAGVLPVSIASAASAEQPVAPPQIQVVIDTSTLEPELSKRLRQALDEQVTAALREQGLEVVSGGAADRLEVRIEMRNIELREYGISLELELEGEREILIDALGCPSCREALVIEQTLALLPAAVRRIEAQPAPAPAPAPEPTPLPERRLGPVGITGIATLSGGVASMIGGVVLVQGGFALDNDTEGFKRKGATAGSFGVVALLLGATALALDLTVLDRQRRERSVKVHIDGSATSASMWLTGSF